MAVKKSDSAEILERFHGALDLVTTVARQVRRTVGSSLQLEELESYGREGLLEASRRFDATRGVPFRPYACFRVRGAILDGVRSSMPLPRRVHERLRGLSAADRVEESLLEDTYTAPRSLDAPTSQADAALAQHLSGMASAMTLGMIAAPAMGDEGEPMARSLGAQPDEDLARAELLELVRREIDGLPRAEAELVRRHYLQDEQFDVVARDLGLSKSWASRLHARAMQRLSRRLADL